MFKRKSKKSDPDGTKRQSVYMQTELHLQVERLAEAEGRSVNAQYVQLLREGIEAREGAK